MENTNELLDTQNQEVENAIDNQTNNNVITINGKEYTPDEIIALQRKEEHWKKKFNKLQDSLKDEDNNAENKPAQHAQSQNNDKKLDVLYFKQMHPELEIADIEEIIDISSAKGVQLEEAYKMPLIQNNLKYKAINKQNQDATPNTSRAAKTYHEDKLDEISKITDPEAHKRAVLGL